MSNSSPSDPADEEMDLYLKIIKTVPFKVKGCETIRDLKALVHETEGIAENSQNLLFDGDLLVDDQRLIDCGIKRNSTLHLFVQNCVAMKLFVKIPSDERTIMVEATLRDTVQNIKSMIQAKEGIQSDECTLVYDGNLLEDDMTLASFNIRNESTIHLVFSVKDVMSIMVKGPSGGVVKLRVKTMFTVRDVKAIAGSMIGVSANDCDLSYDGMRLEDFKTLASYSIKEASFLELLPASIQIFIKTWIGKTLALAVQQSSDVQDIKTMVFEKLKIPVHRQRIIYGGKRLEDGRDLASYNIQKHSTLHMVFATSSKAVGMSLSDIGCSLTSTVRSLKTMIQTQRDVPVKEVLFMGVALHDEHTLAHYKIKENSRVTVVFEIQGI